MSVSVGSSFNVEDVLRPSMKEGGHEDVEPKVEQLMNKLKKLQQGKRATEEEVKEAHSLRDSLQEELDALQTEAYQLEGVHKEKEELCRVLQFQCEEMEQDSTRQQQLNRKSEDLIEQYRCQIQETKLKHRKHRMKFENQLQQLIEQHKNLHSVFSPDRLPAEIESVENTKSQLLKAAEVVSALPSRGGAR
ncbi:synaptonemal complex central element protein 1 isoform X2 [Coregonus clupeaformis]|uniref:synaptonemal complex central element protein 1 isoform X2 n=1 Tax=Coregonus clupeaformis TaxID=59861 RepID=UPI001BE01311|nr:synaptonemal complex central element protein 1 isoform X2 [Coregonus clupeaformis]